jgi:hypothetical protein
VNVLVVGGRDFDDPLVFRRAMAVTMSELSDDTLTLLLAGPKQTNELARHFINLSEDSFKARGKSIKFRYVLKDAVDWTEVDMVVSLVNPPQRNTVLGYEAEGHNVPVNVFRY